MQPGRTRPCGNGRPDQRANAVEGPSTLPRLRQTHNGGRMTDVLLPVDTGVRQAVQLRLTAVLLEDSLRIRVMLRDDDVVLAGNVPTVRARTAALAAIGLVPGALGVLDELVVEPPSVHRSDADLDRTIVAALLELGPGAAGRVKVEVRDGVVLLTGMVDSKDALSTLVERVHALPGVSTVLTGVELHRPAPPSEPDDLRPCPYLIRLAILSE
jgi:osmotically-inducible protein OsmY